MGCSWGAVAAASARVADWPGWKLAVDSSRDRRTSLGVEIQKAAELIRQVTAKVDQAEVEFTRLVAEVRGALAEVDAALNNRVLIAPESYSLDEAAEALRVSRVTVERLIRSGELASFTIGARRLVSKAQLANYVAERSAIAS